MSIALTVLTRSQVPVESGGLAREGVTTRAVMGHNRADWRPDDWFGRQGGISVKLLKCSSSFVGVVSSESKVYIAE